MLNPFCISVSPKSARTAPLADKRDEKPSLAQASLAMVQMSLGPLVSLPWQHTQRRGWPWCCCCAKAQSPWRKQPLRQSWLQKTDFFGRGLEPHGNSSWSGHLCPGPGQRWPLLQLYRHGDCCRRNSLKAVVSAPPKGGKRWCLHARRPAPMPTGASAVSREGHSPLDRGAPHPPAVTLFPLQQRIPHCSGGAPWAHLETEVPCPSKMPRPATRTLS